MADYIAYVLLTGIVLETRDGNQVTKKSEEELREVFRKVDEDGSGALERDELSLLAKVIQTACTIHP